MNLRVAVRWVRQALLRLVSAEALEVTVGGVSARLVDAADLDVWLDGGDPPSVAREREERERRRTVDHVAAVAARAGGEVVMAGADR